MALGKEPSPPSPKQSAYYHNNDKLRALALGGIGEIGMNCYVLEYGTDIIVIDCGHMQPESEMLGIDMVIPDFSHLFEKRDHVRGVILTHGHEDHIGALPFFLSQVNAPVYGTPLTLGLIRFKLEEFNLINETTLVEMTPRKPISLGPFTILPFRVTHTLADSVGLAVETPIGNLIFSGDYKFESNTELTDDYDFETVTSYGDKGVLALFADSTNVERRGCTPSEKEVAQNLEGIFRKTRGSLVISTFASSINRIQTILDLAVKYNRDIFINGLNMVRNIRLAQDMGYLNLPGDRIREMDDLEATPPVNRLLLSTGSQGEPLSVMSRLALDDFKWMKLDKDDVVVISARIIPGNEKAILKMINHFSKRGARVYYEWIENVHASGHAYREDMKRLIRITRPRYLIPVHGEHRHLNEHRDLAVEIGMDEDAIFILENGAVLEFDGHSARRAGDVETGRVLVDGKILGDVGEVVLRDRHHLSRDGMVIAILAIDSHTGELVAGPYIVTRGFVVVDESQELLEEARDVVLQAFMELDQESKEDWGVVKTAVRNALKKFVRQKTARFPMILPVVLEI